MILKKLELKNYRNYKNACLNFNSGLNILIGNNAQGKTNILESIYVLSLSKSFLTNNDKNLIKIGADSAKINDVVSARERRPGDRYPFGGMTRNVKKLLQSTKLPLETRRFLPVFTVGDEIIWLPGFPVSDRFRPCGDQVAELWFFSEKNSDSSRKE